ncbi:MAG: glutamate synthase subunit beta [Calditrichaeota bacterium]|nr:MAG: glutamate synthase subunit beta [Calditrichota bacterium]MBL1205632.1 glutamate synthase subunit beta [Calditrichota bacterium]NOG45460.1 glutamate synthase subunit beta [Calditrichota bacterium]
MGKATGFLEHKRQKAQNDPVKKRLQHYKEFTKPWSNSELSEQGARCMDCGVPFCHSSFGCPVINLIPEWNDFVYRDQWREAYERLEITNNFPEFTGRVCPAPCETACTLSINDTPVTIKQLELAIIERAFQEGWVVPRPPKKLSGKSVAIIGSGPAGLAAAQELRRMGHDVTIFERSLKLGGLLRYGIPDFKLEKHIIDRRLQQMKEEGVVFKTDVAIGADLSARYLKKSFDVILIATGAGKPRPLEVPGSELDGVHFAMEYLTKSNLYVDGQIDESGIISAKDKNVLVIGGGDTGSDCVGTANRQGAKKVTQYEIMPKPREWKNSWNPEWPNWPMILRTSSSHEEGCERDWAILTKELKGENGELKSGQFQKVEWLEKNGRFNMKPVPGSDFTLDIDLVFLAMGFVHVEQGSYLKELEIEYDERGNIKAEKYMTTAKGVFTAGDANTGTSLIVRAIYHGREAAKAIDEYLK